MGDSDPIDVDPAAITFGIRLHTHEAELGTDPLTLTHLVSLATVRKLLTIETIGETDLRFTVEAPLVVLQFLRIRQCHLGSRFGPLPSVSGWR